MEVYLFRHGIAVEKNGESYPNDEDRPLTMKGQRLVQQAARGLQSILRAPPNIILTSPLARAKKTAELLAATLNCPRRMKVLPALAPSASEIGLLKALGNYSSKKVILLVGHEPNLSNFLALLLQIRHPCCQIKKGGVCRVQIETLSSPHPGIIKCLLTQKQLIALGA